MLANFAKNISCTESNGSLLGSVCKPRLKLDFLMPQLKYNNFTSLSLFSGGGGMDLGFDKAGFRHLASYEILEFAANTIRLNRPKWKVFSGQDGDVTKVNWRNYYGKVDVLHGGPPCQPFSIAGNQNGKDDPRDMFPIFVKCITLVKPKVFVVENVPGLIQKKFNSYINDAILKPLNRFYAIQKYFLNTASFGVPQNRKRIIFVGIQNEFSKNKYSQPKATHTFDHLIKDKINNQMQLEFDAEELPLSMGVRQALGLPDIGVDALSPTFRSALTGPRHTTSILSSMAALKTWNRIKVWPNGVAPTREKAQAFVPANLHYRLSVPECALIQGFPDEWIFEGPVYKSLGQIGNSVSPLMSYAIAKSILDFLNN